MLESLISGLMNHLLGEESWAPTRLRLFCGSVVRFELASLAIAFEIDARGFLISAPERRKADVLIRLPDDALLRLLTDRESVFGAARLSGSAEFAEALGFVFRNLRWDAEADLSRFTGDIVARRVVGATRVLSSAHQENLRRLTENLVEYAADEKRMLVRPDRLALMSSEISKLKEDMAQLERRISLLRK